MWSFLIQFSLYKNISIDATFKHLHTLHHSPSAFVVSFSSCCVEGRTPCESNEAVDGYIFCYRFHLWCVQSSYELQQSYFKGTYLVLQMISLRILVCNDSYVVVKLQCQLKGPIVHMCACGEGLMLFPWCYFSIHKLHIFLLHTEFRTLFEERWGLIFQLPPCSKCQTMGRRFFPEIIYERNI